jgi:hypothetical protein
MSQFDNLLHRKIQSGTAYNGMFPALDKLERYHSEGNTFHSVKEMAKMVRAYYPQCYKIAPLLKKPTLKATTEAIYRFLYHHIQYKQDPKLQQLRNPANSWANRQVGIDCKSYSIFASCILSALQVKHYIRQIKQPLYKPTRFTHVYIVVPHNQTTGSLQDGHYVIDATVSSNKEPLFITKEDVYMDDKLPHVWLTGVAKKSTKSTAKTRKPRASKPKKPMTRKKRKTVASRRSKTGLGNTLLLGLGAIVGLSQLTK